MSVGTSAISTGLSKPGVLPATPSPVELPQILTPTATGIELRQVIVVSIGFGSTSIFVHSPLK